MRAAREEGQLEVTRPTTRGPLIRALNDLPQINIDERGGGVGCTILATYKYL